jgi:hypothetical protein
LEINLQFHPAAIIQVLFFHINDPKESVQRHWPNFRTYAWQTIALSSGSTASINDNNLRKVCHAIFWNSWHFTLGVLVGVPYFPADTAHAVLFKEMDSINYWSLIKIRVVSKENSVSVSSPSFSLNVCINQATTYGGEVLRTLNMNKICPRVQLLARHRHTDKQHSKIRSSGV